MSDFDYEDGIDNSNQIKFERTNNRDIMATLERINRAEKFRESANDVVEIIEKTAKSVSLRLFKQCWRNKHPSHKDPINLSISVSVDAPYSRKVHLASDNDKYFIPHKEYPFYYPLNLRFGINLTMENGDVINETPSTLSDWYLKNVAPSFNKEFTKSLKEFFDKKFSNIFIFPDIETVINTEEIRTENVVDKDGKIIADVKNFQLYKINVRVTSNIKHVKSQTSANSITFPTIGSADMKNACATSIAMAIDKVIHQ